MKTASASGIVARNEAAGLLLVESTRLAKRQVQIDSELISLGFNGSPAAPGKKRGRPAGKKKAAKVKAKAKGGAGKGRGRRAKSKDGRSIKDILSQSVIPVDGDGMTVDQATAALVKKGVATTVPTVRQALISLVKTKNVKRPGRGLYVLASKSVKANEKIKAAKNAPAADPAPAPAAADENGDK